ncbi:thermonuclease family protein [Candidatus Pelagibacter sp.]|nr:thermonuclease family protein [Candidatus Pelagibacter sp.]
MFLNKRKAIFLISVTSLIFILIINQVKSQTIKIVDGDTIHLNGEKIRFTGIDTPELKQTCLKEGIKYSCGVNAKQILIDKIGNNNVECISEGKDQYKRTLAECFVNNESLSSYLVRSGYAFAYRRYSKKFVTDEDYARINKIGMWSMVFDYPWDYRKSKKN